MIKLRTSCFVQHKNTYYFYIVKRKKRKGKQIVRKKWQVASELEASKW